MARQGQHDGGREPVGGQLDRRPQDFLEGQPSVALVQGEPPVDGAGHRHAADVAPQWHHGHALGAHPRRIRAGAGAPDRQERLGWRPRRRHHGEDVAPEPAQVGAHDRHDGAGGHRGVGGGPATSEHADAGRDGQLVGRRDHAAQPRPGAEGGEWERHRRRQRTTTERRTSPRCMRAKASSTSPMPMVSLTKRSRSSRPSR